MNDAAKWHVARNVCPQQLRHAVEGQTHLGYNDHGFKVGAIYSGKDERHYEPCASN